MIEACENTGLINKNGEESLLFALEPEAASLYCSKCGDIKKEFIESLKYYIICDLDGGTGDIVAHLVEYNDSLEEITQSDGGTNGTNEICKKLFFSISEDEVIIFDEWCELERQIKNFKEGAILEKINNKKNFLFVLIFWENFFNEDIGLNDLIEKYNSLWFDDDLKLKVKNKKKWIIEFLYKLIDNYILEQAKLIWEKMKKFYQKLIKI